VFDCDAHACQHLRIHTPQRWLDKPRPLSHATGEEDSEDGAESDEQASGCSGGAAAKGRRAGSEGPQEEDLLATNADKLNADTQRIMRGERLL
jgi:hypothetical protein